jgi:hypothetical protein
MNCGSVDSFHVWVTCGLSPKVRQIRETVDWDTPAVLAIDPGGPVRVPARRCLLQRRGDHLLHLGVADRPGPSRPRLIRQPLQPRRQEPRPPLGHRVPGNAQLGSDSLIRVPGCAGQDDPRPQRQRLRCLPPARPGFQRGALLVSQVKRASFGLGTAEVYQLPRNL